MSTSFIKLCLFILTISYICYIFNEKNLSAHRAGEQLEKRIGSISFRHNPHGHFCSGSWTDHTGFNHHPDPGNRQNQLLRGRSAALHCGQHEEVYRRRLQVRLRRLTFISVSVGEATAVSRVYHDERWQETNVSDSLRRKVAESRDKNLRQQLRTTFGS